MLSAATTLLAVLSLLPTNPLSSAFAAPNAQPAAPLHFPLLRRNAQPKSATDYASIADNLRLKYGRPAVNPASKLRRAGNVANIATTNQQADSSYFAPIQVGTPYVCLTFFSCLPTRQAPRFDTQSGTWQDVFACYAAYMMPCQAAIL